jgi:hypothetical protein
MVKKVGSLDTLAQLGTKSPDQDPIILSNTTKKGDKEVLQKRARAKSFSSAIAVGLVEASEKADGAKIRSYWRSYHCAAVASLHTDGKVTSKYCKTRWCVVCNRIRTAKVINQYLPDLKKWQVEDDLYMVTLTDVNVPAADLRGEVLRLKDHFRKIAESAKKQAQRGQRDKFMAIRKLECTYSYRLNNYNPHIHTLVKGKENAQFVLDQHLKRSPTADRKGQDISLVSGSGGMLEVFKYSAKMITKVGSKRKVNLSAMHEIYKAFDGVRTLQPYGFRCSNIDSVVSAEERTKAAVLKEYEWDKYTSDWIADELQVDESTGEVLGVICDPLSGYTPSDNFTKFLDTGLQLGDGGQIDRLKKIPDRDPYRAKAIKPKNE